MLETMLSVSDKAIPDMIKVLGRSAVYASVSCLDWAPQVGPDRMRCFPMVDVAG